MSVTPPEWVKDAVFYQIFPDRFAASHRVVKPGPLESWDAPPTLHGFKGGDLLGIAEHLDELADLGITALYLTPIFMSASNHRYHTYDYLHVDPLLGGDAALRELLDADALSIIEGALTVSEMAVRDIMIPRAQVDFIDINEPVEKFVRQVIATAHSRFPVIDQNRDDVIGVLLAKDLLRFYAGEEEFNVREMLRPAVFVPEAKRLNVLLREFRASRNHMAIVIDEYGGVAGLLTIEDVLEQIVGDIEDEYDFDDVEDNIVPEKGGQYRVKALTEIADFNAAFGTNYDVEEFDTIGGLVLSRFGRVPKRGEQLIATVGCVACHVTGIKSVEVDHKNRATHFDQHAFAKRRHDGRTNDDVGASSIFARSSTSPTFPAKVRI